MNHSWSKAIFGGFINSCMYLNCSRWLHVWATCIMTLWQAWQACHHPLSSCSESSLRASCFRGYSNAVNTYCSAKSTKLYRFVIILPKIQWFTDLLTDGSLLSQLLYLEECKLEFLEETFLTTRCLCLLSTMDRSY